VAGEHGDERTAKRRDERDRVAAACFRAAGG
jgi:hypothetical protein